MFAALLVSSNWVLISNVFKASSCSYLLFSSLHFKTSISWSFSYRDLTYQSFSDRSCPDRYYTLHLSCYSLLWFFFLTIFYSIFNHTYRFSQVSINDFIWGFTIKSSNKIIVWINSEIQDSPSLQKAFDEIFFDEKSLWNLLYQTIIFSIFSLPLSY